MDTGFKSESIKFLIDSKNINKILMNFLQFSNNEATYNIQYRLLTDMINNFFDILIKESKSIKQLEEKLNRHNGYYAFKVFDNGENFFKMKENIDNNFYKTNDIIKLSKYLNINLINKNYKDVIKILDTNIIKINRISSMCKRYKDVLLNDSKLKSFKVRTQITRNDYNFMIKEYDNMILNRKDLINILIVTKEFIKILSETDEKVLKKYLLKLKKFYSEFFLYLKNYRDLLITVLSYVELISEDEAKDIKTDRSILI